ncbi:MAG: tetratricopeptide repeat protein, partial [Anaerolineae bacterium]|nr:tetratricopeptide repeat protein [Anaerolineae bacterium]
LLEDNWVDQAIAELEEILSGEPASPEAESLMVTALTRRGEDLIEASNYDEALSVLERALGYSDDAKALRALVSKACTRWAHHLSQEKQVEQAIAILERGLRLAPQDADIKTNLCACCCERGRLLNNEDKFDAAIEVLERALEVDARNAQARNYLQITLLNKAGQLAKGRSYGRYDQALTVAQRAIALGDLAPEHRKFVAHLYNERGVARWNSGDHVRARSDFEQAFKFDPTDSAIQQNLVNSGGVASLDPAVLMEILRQKRR